MQTQETAAKPITFDMSKAVPIGKSGFDPNNLLNDLTQAQLDSPAWNGTKFRELRRKDEITQEEIAERTELTQERISQIENGARMTEESGTLLWNALLAISYEKGEEKIKEARARAIRLRGTPEGEAEAKKAGAWFEGFYAAGGMGGWLSAGEKESMEKVIAAQKKIIESLEAQLAVHEKQSNWQPVILELAEQVKQQKEVIDMLVNLLDVETVKGLASKEAEELREEIATRFKRPAD